jgi:hypothetical protein
MNHQSGISVNSTEREVQEYFKTWKGGKYTNFFKDLDGQDLFALGAADLGKFIVVISFLFIYYFNIISYAFFLFYF